MRREFPKAVKVAIIKRATRNDQVFCEGCGALAKRWQIDHVRPDGLLGEPTLENAQLLGPCCYTPKNATDTADIAQAKRREAAHVGAKQPSGSFRKKAKERKPLRVAAGLPRIAREYGIKP